MRERRSQAIAAAIGLLVELYPKAFAIYQERRRPLKLGVHLDLQAALDGVITVPELHRALGFYCSNPSYLGRLREGTPRLDLDGMPAGTVTIDEEALARARLARIKVKKANRAAAIKAQAPAVKRLSSLADLKAAVVKRKLGP